MTMRERMLRIVRGEMPDRVPFVQYSGLAAPDAAVWERVGRENMGLLRWTGVHRLETPHCSFTREELAWDGRRGFRQTLHTPEGRLFEERIYEPAYGTSAARTHFVKEPKDYRALLAYLRDVRVRLDLGPFYETLEALGDDGLPHVAVLRSPFQQLWIQWVSLTDLAGHVAEYPEVMAEVFATFEEVQRRVFETVCGAACLAPIPYVDVPDNITAPVIGEAFFRRHCLPAYDLLAAMLSETGKDIPVYVHMDGNLRPLWQAIADSRVRGLDSMSPPPDNDTSVAEAVARWPEMRIGVNYPSSVHLAPPDQVYAHTIRLLEEGAHTGRLQIQVSENVPAGVWERSFPALINAIHDFCG